MTEKPILFSGPMVRAILEGRKTQTRRVCGDRVAKIDHLSSTYYTKKLGKPGWESGPCAWHCPYGKPGDRLWVRETWTECQTCGTVNHVATINQPRNCKACDDYIFSPNRPSIHMARSASRITLEVTGVRVERVQDITESDANAEGCWRTTSAEGVLFNGPLHPVKGTPKVYQCARAAFHALWDSINADRGFGWDVNPWVWVIEFQKL